VAFLSDHDGQFDVWLSSVGPGRLVNLTKGTEQIVLGGTRQIGFSGDGTEVWLGGPQAPGNVLLPSGSRNRPIRLLSITGGAPRDFISGGPTIAWSPNGKRLAYHLGDKGDPIFVADATGANPRQIFVGAEPGVHCHYPIWSLDDQWIYFVSGYPSANQMDLYRISPEGGNPERLTHNSYVADPAPISVNTVLYLARAEDGTGPWLHALDVSKKVTHRIGDGLTRYTSLSASADGRRVVASVGSQSASLWSVPILEHTAEERRRPYRRGLERRRRHAAGASGDFSRRKPGRGSAAAAGKSPIACDECARH